MTAQDVIWRVLIVDDKQADETGDFIGGNKVVQMPNSIEPITCKNFDAAIKLLTSQRVDLVVLDLKDDANEIDDDKKPYAGELIFEEVKKLRFIPIIFYTAFPDRVRQQISPYVRVVSRGQERELRSEIQGIFETGLPHLVRHIEDEQRQFMWEHILGVWKDQDLSVIGKKIDLSFLLARRLANSLEKKVVRKYLQNQGIPIQDGDPDTFHPVEMYIYPPLSQKIISGDIIKGKFQERDGYWFVVTPTCDLEHGKVEDLVLAECKLLRNQPEFTNISNDVRNGNEISNGNRKNLISLITNNRNMENNGKRFQPSRYIFLPQTFFLPDLVVDFQALLQVPLDQVKLTSRLASLDSPYAEAYIAQFSEYYGRLGTPDIAKDIVVDRIICSIAEEDKKSKTTRDVPTIADKVN